MVVVVMPLVLPQPEEHESSRLVVLALTMTLGTVRGLRLTVSEGRREAPSRGASVRLVVYSPGWWGYLLWRTDTLR